MAGYVSPFKTTGRGDKKKLDYADREYTSPFADRDYRGSKKTGYSDPTKDYRAQQKQEQSKRVEVQAPVQPQQTNAERGRSLFDKVKKFTKDNIVDPTVTTGQKSVNTVAAGGTAITGAVKASVQAMQGNKKAAAETVSKTQKRTDEILDKGAGGKGGFLTSKQAKSGGDGMKGFKDNYVKPTSQAVADVAPIVAPGTRVIKGASLLTKAMRGAADDIAVAGSTTVANQAIQGRFGDKESAKETAKSVLTGALFGAVGGAASHGIEKGRDRTADAKRFVANTATQGLLERANKAPNTVPEAVLRESEERKALQPGDTVKPQRLTEDPAAYFNVSDKTKKAPVSSLILTKPAEDNVRSSGEAVTRMEAAAAGQMDKRDPVLVYSNPDGTNQVLDGNATATVAQAEGWNELPIDPVTSKRPPEPTEVEAAKAVIDRARAEDPAFQETMQGVASAVGVQYHGGKPKNLGRTLTKIVDDYEGDASRIKDTIRGTMELTDPAGLDGVVAKLPPDYKVVGVKNTLDRPNGYRDVKLTIETPGGHKGEVILATPEMLKAKHELGGHDLYKQARTTVDAKELADLEAKMNKLYADADAATTARLASSGDSSLPSTSALAGGNGASVKTLTPETLAPSESSRTTASSTSKKRGYVGDSVESSIPTIVAEKATKSKSEVSKQTGRLTPTQTSHMETIGGYNHSTDMVKDYAETLRGMELEVKGGQMTPDGDGGYRRTSEHSPFYRAFYKENKKPPTKADYLEEAERQLATGKDMYSAGEDYKALVEREGKPIPRAVPELPASTTDAKTNTSKLAKGVEQKAIEAKLTKGLGDLPQYSKVDMKDQAEKAGKLLAGDEQKANRIALGQEMPDGDLLPEAVFTAVEAKALKDGNIDLIRQLSSSTLVGEATAMGQRIRALADRSPDSAVAAVTTLAETRKKAYEAKQKKTVKASVAAELYQIRKAVPKQTKETWESFIDGIKC